MDLIRVKNVEKKYRNGVTAIYDLNLAIEKGSFVFIIGGSGSGKSTMCSLIPRFYDVTEGSIKIDGKNIKKAELLGLAHEVDQKQTETN